MKSDFKAYFALMAKTLCGGVFCMLVFALAYASEDNETKFNNLPIERSVAIFDDQDINKFWFRNEGDHGTMAYFDVDSMPFEKAVEIRTHSLAPFSDYLRLSLDTPIKLKQNDLILISFYARTIKPNKDGIGRIGVILQRSSKPWTVHLNWPLEIGTEWKQYYVPFAVSVRRGLGEQTTPAIPPGGDKLTFAKGEVRFGFKFGYSPQVIQLANLKGVNFGDALPGEMLPYTKMKTTSDTIFLSPELSRRLSEGEPWVPSIATNSQGRYLHDFSFAGYHFGENKLPTQNSKWKRIDVRNYGAIANDQKDDTSAIQRAINAAKLIKEPVVMEFPPGTFNINAILMIKRDHLIMRGSGSGEGGSILKINRPMKEMDAPRLIAELESEIRENDLRTDDGEYFSPFSWTGGVIWVDVSVATPAEPLAEIVSASSRGDHTVTVDSALSLNTGQVVQIRWHDSGRGDSLWSHIYDMDAADMPGNFEKERSDGPQVWQNLTIQAIKGRQVIFKEPINHDIRKEWKAEIRKTGFVREVGFHGFTIEFPPVAYRGRHREDGYNAIYVNRALHSWVKDINIVNCDSGIIVDNSKNITIHSVKFTGRGGHYALMARNSDQVLFCDFEIGTDTMLYPSMNMNCRTTVFTHGKINGAQLDQRNGLNHINLWDDMEINGVLGNLWMNGGSSSGAPSHAAFNVSWNLRFNPQRRAPTRVNDVMNGPSAYFIGLTSSSPLMFRYGPKAFIDGLNQPNMAIPSLYEYQLNNRIGDHLPKITPMAKMNPRGDNPFEVYFFGHSSEAPEIDFTSYQWKLGSASQPNGALISIERSFYCTLEPAKSYYIWLRAKDNQAWGAWEKVKIVFDK